MQDLQTQFLIFVLFQFIIFGVMHIKSTVLYYNLYYFIFAIVISAIFLHYTNEAYDIQIMDEILNSDELNESLLPINHTHFLLYFKKQNRHQYFNWFPLYFY